MIPTLLVDGRGRLVKTLKFGKRLYIGDPINAVRIFNTKEVDELILLDIDAARERRAPNYTMIEDIVGEAFMPVGYGGGISKMVHVQQLYSCGIEKVILSTSLSSGTRLVSEVAKRYGNQAVVVCLQVKRHFLGGYRVRVLSGTRALGGGAPEAIARLAVDAGAGELIVYSIDRDGTYQGYDLALLRRVSAAVEVPVVACGGARDLHDFHAAIVDGGCSAVAAGSMFVLHQTGRGVLISYPSQVDLESKVFEH